VEKILIACIDQRFVTWPASLAFPKENRISLSILRRRDAHITGKAYISTTLADSREPWGLVHAHATNAVAEAEAAVMAHSAVGSGAVATLKLGKQIRVWMSETLFRVR
jgi:hypothetical protein